MISIKQTVEKRYKVEFELTEDEMVKIHNGLKAALSMNGKDPAPIIQYPELVEQVANGFECGDDPEPCPAPGMAIACWNCGNKVLLQAVTNEPVFEVECPECGVKAAEFHTHHP